MINKKHTCLLSAKIGTDSSNYVNHFTSRPSSFICGNNENGFMKVIQVGSFYWNSRCFGQGRIRKFYSPARIVMEMLSTCLRFIKRMLLPAEVHEKLRNGISFEDFPIDTFEEGYYRVKHYSYTDAQTRNLSATIDGKVYLKDGESYVPRKVLMDGEVPVIRQMIKGVVNTKICIKSIMASTFYEYDLKTDIIISRDGNLMNFSASNILVISVEAALNHVKRWLDRIESNTTFKLLSHIKYKPFYILSGDSWAFTIMKMHYLGQSVRDDGYRTVTLRTADNRTVTPQVHRLVYETFFGNISKKRQVDHISGYEDDSHMMNLQPSGKKQNREKKYPDRDPSDREQSNTAVPHVRHQCDDFETSWIDISQAPRGNFPRHEMSISGSFRQKDNHELLDFHYI